MFSASIEIRWLADGLLILNSSDFKLPCLKCKKYPVLELPEPRPSSLYKNARLFPGTGFSSLSTLSSVSIPVETISKVLGNPLTAFVKEYTGTSVPIEVNLYCCVSTPLIASVNEGLPIVPFCGNALFNTRLNCSDQLALLGSFQIIVCSAKLVPLLSTNDSVVLSVSNFNNPLAGWFLFAL